MHLAQHAVVSASVVTLVRKRAAGNPIYKLLDLVFLRLWWGMSRRNGSDVFEIQKCEWPGWCALLECDLIAQLTYSIDYATRRCVSACVVAVENVLVSYPQRPCESGG